MESIKEPLTLQRPLREGIGPARCYARIDRRLALRVAGHDPGRESSLTGG